MISRDRLVANRIVQGNSARNRLDQALARFLAGDILEDAARSLREGADRELPLGQAIKRLEAEIRRRLAKAMERDL